MAAMTAPFLSIDTGEAAVWRYQVADGVDLDRALGDHLVMRAAPAAGPGAFEISRRDGTGEPVTIRDGDWVLRRGSDVYVALTPEELIGRRATRRIRRERSRLARFGRQLRRALR